MRPLGRLRARRDPRCSLGTIDRCWQVSLGGWAGGQIGIADTAATTHVIVRLHGLRARRIDVTHGENANYRPCYGTDGS
jgi:hypothetical protein